jgi:hypothetical protein
MKTTAPGLTTEPDGKPVQVREGRDQVRDRADIDARGELRDRADLDARGELRDPALDARGELRERMRRAGSPTHGGVATSWQDIKGQFVDDPAGAIAAAEQLVQRALDDKVRALKDEAAALCVRERQEADTEALRTRLIRYQAYCDRLAGAAGPKV